MLQRIQTVYMLASVIAILMMLLMSLGIIESPDAVFNITALGITSVTEEVPLDQMRYGMLFLLLLMLALPLVCIFMYKRRKLQQRILIYTMVVDLLFYAYYWFFELDELAAIVLQVLRLNDLPLQIETSSSFVLLAMPLLSAFCCLMAWRGVTYDIALLASADRLRPSRK